MNINKVVTAIEADAGVELPGLKESLAEMNSNQKSRIYTKSQLLVREARNLVGYTQPKFAKAIKASVTSVRDWEQGRHEPPGVVSTLMTVIKNHPEVINEIDCST